MGEVAFHFCSHNILAWNYAVKRILCFVLSAYCAMLVSVSVAADPPRQAKPAPASGEQAESAAKKWLDGLGMKGLVIERTVEGAGFVGQQVTGRDSYMYVLNQDGWYVNLGFTGKIDKTTPLKDVRAKFKYIALDRVITPGLDVPGWEVRPQTPVSSFKEGVEFVSLENGQLTLKVKTKFFALYGRNPNILVPADAPSPKGSYFQIRQGFPLELTLTAPVTMK